MKFVVTMAAVAALTTAVPMPAVSAAAPGSVIVGAGHPHAIPGHYLVVYRDGSRADRTATPGVSVTHRYTAPRGFAARTSEAVARRLAADPAVAYVEQDRMVAAAPMAAQPNPSNWGLDRINQVTLPLDGAYNYTATGSNVRAYIIEHGIASHADYNGRLLPGVSTSWDGNDPSCNRSELAGIVGGTVTGVAKAVRMVKVLACDIPAGILSDIVEGIDWVTANHVKPAVALVTFELEDSTGTFQAAVERSIAAGVHYSVAAGNFGGDTCRRQPGNIPAALNVGATDITDRRTSWSNGGPCLDLFAPGQGVTTTKTGGGYASVSHTAYSAAFAAGVAAQYLSGHPTATPAQVSSAIIGASTVGAIPNAGAGTANRLLRTIW